MHASTYHEHQLDIPARPWEEDHMPKRILAIRLQAIGDVVITLPYLQHLRETLPSKARLDLLTREESAGIPKSLNLFDRVIGIGGGRNYKKQLLHSFFLLPSLVARNYDMVIDLQNHPISHLVRRAIRPRAWSVFDRFSPVPAGERTRRTIEALGLGPACQHHQFSFKEEDRTGILLKKYGWDGNSALVLINPAAAFVTRNWPMEYYAEFARLWLELYPFTQFLMMGTSFIEKKAFYLEKELGEKLINLTGKTKTAEAFAILQRVRFTLSEDSGMMHMSWVSGIPTLAIFGGTRSDWARPLGPHTAFVGSSDLPCGDCMQETCKYGDVRCLTRYTPEDIFEKSIALLQHRNQIMPVE
jgi:heptosyltransferase-2